VRVNGAAPAASNAAISAVRIVSRLNIMLKTGKDRADYSGEDEQASLVSREGQITVELAHK
jgi:hypothetical protein